MQEWFCWNFLAKKDESDESNLQLYSPRHTFQYVTIPQKKLPREKIDGPTSGWKLWHLVCDSVDRRLPSCSARSIAVVCGVERPVTANQEQKMELLERIKASFLH